MTKNINLFLVTIKNKQKLITWRQMFIYYVKTTRQFSCIREPVYVISILNYIIFLPENIITIIVRKIKSSVHLITLVLNYNIICIAI